MIIHLLQNQDFYGIMLSEGNLYAHRRIKYIIEDYYKIHTACLSKGIHNRRIHGTILAQIKTSPKNLY